MIQRIHVHISSRIRSLRTKNILAIMYTVGVTHSVFSRRCDLNALQPPDSGWQQQAASFHRASCTEQWEKQSGFPANSSYDSEPAESRLQKGFSRTVTFSGQSPNRSHVVLQAREAALPAACVAMCSWCFDVARLQCIQRTSQQHYRENLWAFRVLISFEVCITEQGS